MTWTQNQKHHKDNQDFATSFEKIQMNLPISREQHLRIIHEANNVMNHIIEAHFEDRHSRTRTLIDLILNHSPQSKNQKEATIRVILIRLNYPHQIP